MTIVVLDPLRPDAIPVRALPFLAGPVAVTEDVHPSTMWELPQVTTATPDDDPSVTLLTSDPTHPLVRARVAAGDRVITARAVSGDALLGAVALMDTLRRTGPWESRQTHASLRRYLLEECYEFLDAIDSGDQGELRSELGDLLLQVLFHARIAADDPDAPFDIDDVARAFVAKVTHRTPGVLTGAHADLETQIREWEDRKAAERITGSVLDGVATTAPALALTQKVLERLDGAGFPETAIPDDVLSVTVTAGGDSVEAQQRDRVLDLMNLVVDAEDRARRDGVTLDSDARWAEYLDIGSDLES